jgi:predicted ATPase
VIALSAVAVNPWSGSLLAFEEPENGVHPRRLEPIAKLLASIACSQERQVIVTTHSPLFCDAMLREARERPAEIALFNVRRASGSTVVQRFESTGPLFQEQSIADGLKADAEDGRFESLILRGLIDE